MLISSLLSLESIIIAPKVTHKAGVITTMLMLNSEWDAHTRQLVNDAVDERESIMSTGVGNGIAIPHAKVSGLKSTALFVGVLDKAIDYESFDGIPVDLIFLVIGPNSTNSDHLKILSRLSRLLMNATFVAELRSADSKQSVYDTIKAGEAHVLVN